MRRIINTDLYPWISDFASTSARAALTKYRSSFLQSGVATLPNFLTAKSLASAVTECQVPCTSSTLPCYYHDGTHNAYLLPHDPRLPPDHPRNLQLRTKVASIAADELPKGGEIVTLYEDERLMDLVSAVVFGPNATDKVYQSSDPLGRCSINVFKKGYHHSYHFDESEFSTTLNLQQPSPGQGGVFEMTPRIRASSSEMVYDLVSDVLAHQDDPAKVTRTSVSHLTFQPGTLSIFAGRYSLHRVTEVLSERDRLVAVFTYGRKPGFRNSEEVQKMFWGRSTPTDPR